MSALLTLLARQVSFMHDYAGASSSPPPLMDSSRALPQPLATALTERHDIWRGDALGHVATPSIATGFATLDRELPGRGWPTGALTEILLPHVGIGELRLLGTALAALSRAGHQLVWIAPPYLPYAPALAAAGIDLARIIVIKTRSPQETLWASEQALRSGACGAVLAWLHAPKYAQLRRLQIAVEKSRGLALLFRPACALGESSPAPLRIVLDSVDGEISVRIAKRRGALYDKPIRCSSSDQRNVVDSRLLAAIAARSAAARI